MKVTSLSIFIFLLFIHSAFAEVKLPRIVRDSMVLQRDDKVKIWGWASNDEKVTVGFAGKKYKATTGT
ncbi:MAG: hypothetical protein JWQ09_5435, partial [Segetibacter sp.]|nr:hypothetical protein [Segetibacter sp.]